MKRQDLASLDKKKSKVSPITLLKISILFIAFNSNLIFSQANNPTDELTAQLNDLCVKLNDLVPTMAMLLVISGVVIYAGGQLFSAETRARATTWAASCIVGAFLGILIAQILPTFLGAIIGQDISCKI